MAAPSGTLPVLPETQDLEPHNRSFRHSFRDAVERALHAARILRREGKDIHLQACIVHDALRCYVHQVATWPHSSHDPDEIEPRSDRHLVSCVCDGCQRAGSLARRLYALLEAR